MKKNLLIIGCLSILLLFSNCTVSKLFNKSKESEKTETNSKSKEETNIKESYNAFIDVSGSEVEGEVNTYSDQDDSSIEEPQIFENSDVIVTYTNTGKGKGKIKAQSKPKKIAISGTRETNIKKEGEISQETETKKKEVSKEKETDYSKAIAASFVILLLIILFARKWIKAKFSIIRKFF